MPVDRIFRAGFMGASVVDSSRWFGEWAERLKIQSICMPFMGAGRHISACCRERVHMDLWDTQKFGLAVIDGIFNADKIETALDEKPRFKKGYTFNERWLPDMDDLSAGFIDWVGENGTLADRAALYPAISSNTYRGRLDQWTGNIDKLWAKYQKNLQSYEPWLRMPGIWNMYEGNFYDYEDVWGVRPYDLLLIDPPKIVGNTDIYSARYGPLNRSIGGTVEMDKWSWRDYVGRMRRMFDGVEWKYLFFLYTSDVRPDWQTIRRLIEEYGEILAEENWVHRARFDHTVIVRRHQ